MTGFKEFESAHRTLSGIEVVSIIKKDQIINPYSTSFKTFGSVALIIFQMLFNRISLSSKS